jgi:replicative DNA helicase
VNGATKGTASQPELVPPYDLDAEEAVLACMLGSAVARAEARERVRADDFYSPRNGNIFEASCQLEDAGEPVDPVTAYDQLRRLGLAEGVTGGDLVALAANGVPTFAFAAKYGAIVAELAAKRRLASVGAELSSAAMDPARDSAEVRQGAEAALLGTERGDGRAAIVSAADTIGLVADRARAAADRGGVGVAGLPSGYRALDALLGGFEPGALVVVGARPSMGKTAFALGTAATDALRSTPTLFVSAEMGAAEIGSRLAAMVADVPAEAQRSGHLSDAQWGRLERAQAAFSHAVFEVMDQAGPTAGEVRLRARAVKSRHGLGLVCVDYLQLLAPQGKKERRELEIAETAWLLKTMARDLGCVVIALSQLNRGCEARADKRPMLSDLRESGAIEQHADVVMFLYRDEVYNPSSPDRGTAEVIVAKNRNGPTGTRRLAWLATLARFADLAPEPVF